MYVSVDTYNSRNFYYTLDLDRQIKERQTYNSRNFYYALDKKSYVVTFEPTTVGIIIIP